MEGAKALALAPNTSSSEMNKGKEITKAYLINKLHFFHFTSRPVLAKFIDRRFEKDIILKARPEPVKDGILDCKWADKYPRTRAPFLKFKSILIPDGNNLIIVESNQVAITETGLVIVLPESSNSVPSRNKSRFKSDDIDVEFVQNGTLFSGILTEYSPSALKISLDFSPPQNPLWINPDQNCTLIMKKGKISIFAGECRILKSPHLAKNEFILAPADSTLTKFKPKKNRCQRQTFYPPPKASFLHPATGRRYNFNITELSGTGLSIEEPAEEECLIAGMTIPKIEIKFVGAFPIECYAQVIHKTPIDESTYRCGLAILEITPQNQRLLISAIHQAANKNSDFSNIVNLEELWEFFFDTGFIYPDKYSHIASNLESFKNTYEQLYNTDNNIARHFIYKEKGKLLGHLAMVRFYNQTWLAHHHAAIKIASSKIGLIVLDQLNQFLNESHTLSSMGMSYVMAYYRAENKFPSKIYGGLARHLNDPSKCSTDEFGYVHYRCKTHDTRLPSNWTLETATLTDLDDLCSFYHYKSGGLLTQALDLNDDDYRSSAASEEFKAAGLSREKHIFTLKFKDTIKALYILNIADLGINLSDLTSAMKAFIISEDEITESIFTTTLNIIGSKFNISSLPLLGFPVNSFSQFGVGFEKSYFFWVLDLKHVDLYLQFCNRIIFRQKEGS